MENNTEIHVIEAEPPEPPPPPPPARPEQLQTSQVEVARQLFARYLARLSVLLPGYLNTGIEVRALEPGQGSLIEYAAQLEPGGCVITLDLAPLPVSAYLYFGQGFVGTVLEILLGAPQGLPAGTRDSLTEVDRHVIQGLMEITAGELRRAWQTATKSSFRTARIEGAASLKVTDDCAMLALPAELVVHEQVHPMQLLVPSLLIRLAAQAAESEDPEAVIEEPEGALAEALSAAVCDVEAVLPGAGIRLGDLLRLQPGYVLELPHKAGSPVSCQVNGVMKFRGEMINAGQFPGLEIQEWCAPQAEGRAVE